MGPESAVLRMALLLRSLRQDRGVSQRQLADQAGVNVSVVNRAERGMDARLSTWEKLFAGLGYYLHLETMEMSEEAADLLAEEAELRRERRRGGLFA